MFNVRRDESWPGFSVGRPEEPPGFRIGDDGLPLLTLPMQPGSPSIPSSPDARAPPSVNDLLLQTGGPIEANAMTGPQDRFAGNPYWSAEGDHRMASPIIPAGYGSPSPSAPLPRPEEMQTTPPLHSRMNIETQGVPDAQVPGVAGLPSGIGSPQSPITVQYETEGAPPLPASPPKKSPEVDTSPGEVVVLPIGQTGMFDPPGRR